jgi:acetolactate synthase small subunit
MLVENHYGALLKIERFFTTRGYSTSALHVVQGEEMREITVAVRCDETQFGPLQKQLNRIADVVEVMPWIPNERPLAHVAARQEQRTA